MIVVVEEIGDLWALERAGVVNALYHVLGGHLSPLDGVGPEQLNIARLIERAAPPVKEVLLALNSTVEGQSTAHYLTEQLQGHGVAVTRLAQGVPSVASSTISTKARSPPPSRAAARCSGGTPTHRHARALLSAGWRASIGQPRDGWRKRHGSQLDTEGQTPGGESARHGARGDHAAGGRIRGRDRQERQPLGVHQATGGDPRGPQGQGARARPVELLADQEQGWLRAHHRRVRLYSPGSRVGQLRLAPENWPSIAPRPTPATWRCWSATAPPSTRRSG